MPFPHMVAKNLPVPACSGELTIYKARQLFDGNLDERTKDPDLRVVGTPTEAAIFCLVEYQNTQSLPLDLGDPADFEMSQHQIVRFCEHHRTQLRNTEFGTHFIFRNKEKWHVARVRVMFGFLYVLTYVLYKKAQPPFHGKTIWLCQPF